MVWLLPTVPPVNAAPTVTTTVVDELQPDVVPVTVYVVVLAGLAVTVAPDVADKPVEGDHAYVVAPDAVNDTLPEGAMVADEGDTAIVGRVVTVAVPVAIVFVAAFEDVADISPEAPLVAVDFSLT